MTMGNIISDHKFIRANFLIFSLLILFCEAVSGQEVSKTTPPLRERLFYGGNFSLQLGTVTEIQVSPVVGLWVLPRIAVAVGPDYSYFKNPAFETSVYGGRTYVQLIVLRDLNKFIPLGTNTSIFLHTEDEVLSLDSFDWKNISTSPHRFAVNTTLAGVGISQQIGRRAAVNLMVLWPVLESDPSVTSDFYSTPQIKIGFVF